MSKGQAKGPFDAKKWAVNGVTEEDVIDAKKSFDLFDSDQGGSVDINELKAAMVSLGFEAKNGAIFQMISDLDTDGNGTIDFGEWVTLLTKKVSDKDSRDNIAKVFALYDRDGSGTISIQSLRTVADELGESVDENELRELLQRADANGDGVVDFEEFYSIVTRPIKQ